MASVWIIHRDERLRAALARLAGVGEDSVHASPDDARLADAVAPRLVVLGLAGDLESELEFAHRHSERLRGTRWLLVCEEEDREEAEALFAALRAEVVTFPPTAAELRGRIRASLAARSVAGLAERRVRDAVAERFARWFADLELPEVLRALDPRLAGVPLLVRGEPGTGRGLLARYVHTFGAGGAWIELPCASGPDPGALLLALAGEAARLDPGASRVTVCLTDVDRLPPASQHEVRGWIELAPPAASGALPQVRWMASADDDRLGALSKGLDASLALALAGLGVRIPPLRERPLAIAPFAADTALAWCRSRGERPRTLAPDAIEELGAQPWPGNLRELEACIARTLSAEGADPIHARHLRIDAEGAPAVLPAPPRGAEEGPAQEGLAELEAPAPVPVESAEPARDSGPVGPAAAPIAPDPGEQVRRLARSLAHEVRNPLVAIRTFSELLPERAEDPEFRREFAQVVGQDVSRIERVLERLASYAELASGPTGAVDLAALLEEQLEGVRDEIERRRLLVLKELDRSQAEVQGDRGALALAFELLLGKALEWMPDRADVYLAARHHPSGLRGGPSVRVVLRFYRPGAASKLDDEALAALSGRETSLEVAIAELLIRAQGGQLAMDNTDAEETVIVVDLPVL